MQRYGLYSHLIAIATTMRQGTTGLGAACVGGLPDRARRAGGRGRRTAGKSRPAALFVVRPLMGGGARRRWAAAHARARRPGRGVAQQPDAPGRSAGEGTA